MKQSLVGILIIALTAACNLSSDEDNSRPPGVDELILGYSVEGPISIESRGLSGVVISWTENSASCELSDAISQSWETVRAASQKGDVEIRKDLALDPNRYSLGTLLVFVRRGENGINEISYIEDEREIVIAAEAVQSILVECSLPVKFGVVYIIYPSE